MEILDQDPEVLIDRVGWRPRCILASMVTIRNIVAPTFVPKIFNSSSSMGLLSLLPLELLHLVLELLDFQTLSRLARVCHRATAGVDSLPAYRDLIKHALPTLVAFSRTQLITFHSAAAIYTAFHAQKCVACEQFAPFLFLPTSERCCYECLHRDRSLRLISTGTARKCFGLKPKELRRIPALLSIPGNYSLGQINSSNRRIRLFSLKQAEALAIAHHGSAEAMERFVAVQNDGKLTCNEKHTVRWLTGHPSTIGSDGNIPGDRFCGMASTEFPALQAHDVLERGVWCLGCRANFQNYSRTGVLDAETRLLVPSHKRDNASSPLLDMELYRISGLAGT